MTIQLPSRFSGIYGIPEVAIYLSHTPPLTNGNKVDSAKLRYWTQTSIPLRVMNEYPTRQRFVTFLDLVSMRMIAILRSRNVRLREIRHTTKWLQKEFNIEWPLAYKPLWTYGSNVFIEFGRHLLTASRFGQEAMDFIGEWLNKVELDMRFDERNIASSWYPYQDVCLNPKIQFGSPCIDGTRIPTRSIWGKVKAGDKPEIVAKLYDIGLTQVYHAVEWEQRISSN
ncbi:MAG: DUF433 domain-containing protein [Chloroflexota bacterium]